MKLKMLGMETFYISIMFLCPSVKYIILKKRDEPMISYIFKMIEQPTKVGQTTVRAPSESANINPNEGL